MTGFFKGKPRGQVDMLLIDKQEFGEKQIKELIKGVKAEKIVKGKKK